jgi:uncharacterized protein YqeY
VPAELQTKISKELLVAMKSRDEVRTSTLRMVISAMRYKEVEKKRDLSEAEALEVIGTEAKRRRESIGEYKKASREDLAAKEEAELKVLQGYLPEMLSEDELKALALRALTSVGAKGPQDMGRVMSALMPEIKGRADGRQAQQLVQQLLSKSSVDRVQS